MSMANCPDCGKTIDPGSGLALGKEIMCSHCGVELEVVSLDPLELDWAYTPPADEEEPDYKWND